MTAKTIDLITVTPLERLGGQETMRALIRQVLEFAGILVAALYAVMLVLSVALYGFTITALCPEDYNGGEDRDGD